MKTLTLLCLSLVTACASQTNQTPTCDENLGEGWGQGFGSEVESSSNLDSDRCAQVKDVWCCAL